MSFNEYQYKILCEDRSHHDFVRGFLVEKGANDRRVQRYADFLEHINDIDTADALNESEYRKKAIELKKPTQYAKLLCAVLDSPPSSMPQSLLENINRFKLMINRLMQL